ncbi:MAG: ferredoxin [Pseudomonadota bacterium]
MKIKVDANKCQGHALCASQAPDVYELDDTGYNSMGEFLVKAGHEADAKAGAEWCPEEAITVIE